MRQKIFLMNSVRLLLILSCLSAYQNIFSQIKFYSVVSEPEVSYNQTFQVQYVIQGASRIRDFRIPLFDDFQLEEVFEVPSTPALDPKTLRMVDQHSKIAVLTPIRTGSFIIPSATAVINGKRMRSNTIRVKVNASGLSRVLPESVTGRVNDASELKAGEDIDQKVSANFFLRAEVNKTSCYVGEPLMAVYKAYSRLNANSHVVKRPSFTGFSVIEMVDSYEAQPTVEQLNGSSYYVHLIRKVQLFPLQSGNYQLDPAEIEGTIHFIRANDNPDRAEPLYTAVDHNVIVSTKPVDITVLPVPENGQPENFNGAVGDFSIEAHFGKGVTAEGEVMKLLVTISGNGNLPLVTSPAVTWPPGIDGGEPTVKESLNKYSYPVSGSKTFEYSFVAPVTGNYILPRIAFSYFDPVAKSYKILHKDSISFEIHQGRNAGELNHSATSTTKHRGFEIQYLAFSLVALGIISWIAYQSFASWQKKKRKRAEATAVISKPVNYDPFERARLLAEYSDANEFYQETQRILWQVAAEKCEVPPSSLNKQNISNRLSQLGVEPSITKEYIRVIEQCELALYGVDNEVKDKKNLLHRAEQVVKEITNA